MAAHDYIMRKDVHAARCAGIPALKRPVAPRDKTDIYNIVMLNGRSEP